MTSRPIYISIAACAFLFSCQQMETSDNSISTDSLVNTSVYPVQPLQPVTPAGLRLSYTGRTVTDSSVFYQVVSTYKGETYGFNLSVPKKASGIAYLSSRGKSSDDLLRFMEGLYGQPVDSASHMGEYIPASYTSLGALVATSNTDSGRITTGDSSKAQKRDSVKTLQSPGSRPQQNPGSASPQTPENLGTQNKLVFRSAAGDKAEVYLDIDEKEHFIGLMEKDTANRAPLIRCLRQN